MNQLNFQEFQLNLFEIEHDKNEKQRMHDESMKISYWTLKVVLDLRFDVNEHRLMERDDDLEFDLSMFLDDFHRFEEENQ